MWFMIRFILGVIVFAIVATWAITYFDNYDACDKKEGNYHYNLTSHGFKCQRGV